MNNPGINLEIWEQLRNKWTEFEASGKKVKIDFQLIANPREKESILAIDVIQNVNDEICIETVQRKAEEAYTILGIAGLSMEELVDVYKKMMRKLNQQSEQSGVELIVTMSPSTPTSGEVRAFLEGSNPDLRKSVSVNYQHYYMLNALRRKMIDLVGDGWTKVKAIYRSDDLKFYFDY